jgi:ketosteroid isomerase-like protein
VYKRAFRAVAAGAMALAIGAGATSVLAAAPPEQEVRQAVQEIVAAYATPDVDKYFSYYADDMTIFRGPRGRWTKQDYYTGWKSTVEGGGGVAAARVEDLRVQMSPSEDAAVTTYVMPVTSRYPSGSPPAGQASNTAYNMTEVWHKRNGRWQVVHLYFTTATPAPAQ